MESLCGVLGFLLLAAGLPLQAAKRESRPLWALTLVDPNDGPGPLTGVWGSADRVCSKCWECVLCLGLTESKSHEAPGSFFHSGQIEAGRGGQPVPQNKASLPNHPYLLPAHRAELLNEALANFAELPHPTASSARCRANCCFSADTEDSMQILRGSTLGGFYGRGPTNKAS
jgi:hypothetical protein